MKSRPLLAKMENPAIAKAMEKRDLENGRGNFHTAGRHQKRIDALRLEDLRAYVKSLDEPKRARRKASRSANPRLFRRAA